MAERAIVPLSQDVNQRYLKGSTDWLAIRSLMNLCAVFIP